MTGQSSMENNNSIPYGSISWDNEDTFPLANQQREPQGIPPLRPSTLPSSDGMRYSLRGPHFPQPQQRLRGVGISRNLELANHLQQGETPQSSQQPSSSSLSSTPYERFFTLQSSRSTSQTQMHSMEPQSSNCVNSTIEGQCYATLYANPSPGPSSGNPALTSVSGDAKFSARTVYSEKACNNINIEMPQGFTRDGSCERFRASRAKRKSSLSNDEGQDGPSTKQFLSEERMAARMHNLRISSDHNYQVNIMQRFMDSFNQASNSSESQIDYDDEFENADGMQRRRDNLPVFVLSSNVKEAMAKTEPIIPEAIYNQLSKPCLAVVPWKSPDDRLALSSGRKQVHEDKNESEPSHSSSSSCTSLIMESIPEETEQFQDKGVHHVEIVGDCSTFNFDDDDMEL